MATVQNYAITAGDSVPLALALTGYDNATAINLATATQILVYFKRVLADPDSVARIARTLQTTAITLTGSPTGGTWTATIGGQTAAGIPSNATAAQVKAAIEGLSSVGANNSNVFGGPGPGTPWTVVLLGAAAGQAITVSGAGLTGGTAPAATAATTGTITITDAANGKIAVPLLPADTATVQAQLGLDYSAKVFLANGQQITGGTGTLTVKPSYVQATS